MDQQAGGITYISFPSRPFFPSLIRSPSSVNEVDIQGLQHFYPFLFYPFICLLSGATAIQTEVRGLACCGDLCLRDPQLRGKESQYTAKCFFSLPGFDLFL